MRTRRGFQGDLYRMTCMQVIQYRETPKLTVSVDECYQYAPMKKRDKCNGLHR